MINPKSWIPCDCEGALRMGATGGMERLLTLAIPGRDQSLPVAGIWSCAHCGRVLRGDIPLSVPYLISPDTSPCRFCGCPDVMPAATENLERWNCPSCGMNQSAGPGRPL